MLEGFFQVRESGRSSISLLALVLDGLDLRRRRRFLLAEQRVGADADAMAERICVVCLLRRGFGSRAPRLGGSKGFSEAAGEAQAGVRRQGDEGQRADDRQPGRGAWITRRRLASIVPSVPSVTSPHYSV
jgi:hypothetical protein